MLTKDAIQLFINSREAKGCAVSTTAWYSVILSYLDAMYPTLPQKPEQIDKFLKSCKGGDERRHGFYRALKCFYRLLHKRYRVKNVIELIDPPHRKRKLPHSLTHNELLILLNYPHRPDIRAWLIFLSDTGCRIGELNRMQPDDLLRTPFGWVARLSGKTGERYVPITDECYEIIKQYVPIPKTTNAMGKLIKKAFIRCRLEGSAHTLRHTYATLWDASEMALQQILGHTNSQTTKIYRNLRMNQLCKLHKENTPLNAFFK